MASLLRWVAVAAVSVACGNQGSGLDASTDAQSDASDATDCTAPPLHCVCPTLNPICVNGNWECFGTCLPPDAGADSAADSSADSSTD